MDHKNDILEALKQFDTEELLEMLTLYRNKQQLQSPPVALGKDRRFKVCKIPPDIKAQLKRYEDCPQDSQVGIHMSKWVSTIKHLPRYTTPLPLPDKAFLERAYSTWSSEISGLQVIYNEILKHLVRYLRSGYSRPLLLVGSPGCGKSRVAKTAGNILGLPTYFAAALQMAKGQGLSGERNAIIGASPGEVVNSMVTAQSGNCVFVIDEIDKATRFTGYGGDFQDELLQLTSDETASHFKDNFIEFEVDASHLFIVMTANSVEPLSEPLLSRCDILHFPEPSKDTISSILREHTYPDLIRTLNCESEVSMSDAALARLVDLLYESGEKDVRKFQSALERLVNDGLIEHLSTEKSIVIDETHFAPLLKRRTVKPRIGF